ncbi:MAG: Undecaprenyl-phosphate 4-deoxy-4-formamido-L-arabinose transferase [Chloroflexi bacterium ADurb.Bin222]|nr:MAG: Undecaprenyl-phosphate 4-deoxy-4-formamido-L-arabinose transferase [Chloroflexi bacterium ADurb.Bin222]
MLSVVIPAYNEEDGIAEIVERVLAVEPALAQIGVALELLVVDDGSKDRTAEIVRTYPAVRLLQHNPNRGYGAALKTGFCAASGNLLGFLDADGTYPPESFPALCEAALAGADVVVGSRRSGAESGMPLVRKVGNFIWANLVTALSGRPVVDPASGMRVFRREVLARLYPLPDGLNFTPVMSTRAVHEGLNFVELPMPYEERLGRSKLSVVRDGMRFLQTIIWTALTYNPARPLGGVGFGLFCLGAVIAAALAVLRLSGVNELGPWGVAGIFAAMILGIVGFDLFALGATFNYLVALFNKGVVQKGLFGRPIFDPPLDRHFGWMGLVAIGGGVILAIVSLILGLNGWLIERLWLYLTAGAMLVLMGVQLDIFWVIMRVLEELSHRETLIKTDLERDYIC